MKKALKLLAVIALVAVIGFSTAACDDGNGGGGGGGGGGGLAGTTWTYTESGGSATLTFIDSSKVKMGTYNGTYTFNGSSGIITWSDGDSDSFVVNGSTLTSGGLTFTKTGGSSGGGSGGSFTLTNIPSQYNNKYAAIVTAFTDTTNTQIYGYQDVNMTARILISGGTARIPMWCFEGFTMKGYSGNDTCSNLNVVIYNSRSVSSSDPVIAQIVFSSSDVLGSSIVRFSNGSATKSWSQGYVTITP